MISIQVIVLNWNIDLKMDCILKNIMVVMRLFLVVIVYIMILDIQTKL